MSLRRVLLTGLLALSTALTLSPALHAQGLLNPMQKQRLVASGKVGERLVAALGSADRVRVIVTFDVPELPKMQARGLRGRDLEDSKRAIASVADDLLSTLSPGDFEVGYRFNSASAFSGIISTAGLLRLADNPQVVHIDFDEPGRGQLTESRALAKVDSVLGRGYTGVGVTVAVVDSGLDTDHADLAGDLIDQQCFCSTNCCPNHTSRQSGAGSAEDDNGHGTNVTGVITSRGTIAPRGAAPDAKIVAIKVLDSANHFCCTSDVIAALDWIVNNRSDVKVVNMSLGTDALYPAACDSDQPGLAQEINLLRARNVTVYASSGNNLSNSQMEAPACIANTISVGAVYDSNLGSQTNFGCTDSTTFAGKMTCFSNRNAQTDLFAPGALMTSTGLNNSTSTYVGTSQASPMVAACAADLLQAKPSLAASQVESALKSSSTLVTDPTNGRTFPLLDCDKSLAVATACTPSATRLCLSSNRFSVQINWRTSTSSGAGQVASCTTPDSGIFWFFSASNWEMMVKIVNGCSLNSRYWVFAAGTTNVEWTMTVTDTLTGQVKTYFNPLNTTSCAVLDTNAFATCP